MMACYLKVVENDTLPVKHAIIGITDDTQKDNYGVKAFDDEAIKIKEKENGPALTKVNEFTGGCTCQYIYLIDQTWELYWENIGLWS